MRIRNCREQDVDGVRRFVAGCKPLDLHSAVSYWVLFRYCGETCFVLEDEGGIVGFVSGVISAARKGVFFLWQLGVDPSVRRRGCAARLIREAVAAARARGCHTLHVAIEPENEASHRVFSRFAEQEGLTMTRIGALALVDSLEAEKVFETLYEIRL